MPDFLGLPDEPFAIAAASIDEPLFIKLGELAEWRPGAIYACYRECSCIFAPMEDGGTFYPDRFAGINCRDHTADVGMPGEPDVRHFTAQECPCHGLEKWEWYWELEQKELA